MNLRNKFVAVMFLLSTAAFGIATDAPADLLASGRADDAIVSLKNRLANNPNDADSYHLLCRAHFDFQDWDAAIAACEKAVALSPQSSRDHLWLGRAYGEKADNVSFVSAIGLAKKVHAEFEKAVALDPNNADALSDLAEFYLEAPGMVGGGREKAEAKAELLMKLAPSKGHWIKGRIAEKNHDKTTAEREYLAAIQSSHGSGLDWLNLAFYYKRTQRLPEMEAALRKSVAASSAQPEVIVEAAETLVRTNRNLPLAETWLQQYLTGPTVELAPAFKAHYWLGQAQEKQGDHAAAAQSYREALKLAKGYSRAQEALERVERQL